MFNNIHEKTGKLDIACNAMLVEHDVRPAFLIQSIDYNEWENGAYTKGPITTQILWSLKPYFKIYPTHQGFIISKKTIDHLEQNKPLNDTIIGELIGYPCAGHLENDATRKFSYSVMIDFYGRKAELMAVMCGTNMNTQFLQITMAAEDALKHSGVDCKVWYQEKKLYTFDELIQIIKLDSWQEKINTEIKSEIENTVANFMPLIHAHCQQKSIDIFSSQDGLVKILERCKFMYHNENKWNEEGNNAFQEHSLDLYYNFIV
jgi:hypothetical protein